MTSFRVRRIAYLNQTDVPVLCQALNGPCPLLALANALLLVGDAALPRDCTEVTLEDAVGLVANRLLVCSGRLGGSSGGADAGAVGQALEDAIAVLPKLQRGLDLNLRFTAIDAYEYTSEMAVFDLLGIQLVHGWLVDPQDKGAVEVLGAAGMSYNQATIEQCGYRALLSPGPPSPKGAGAAAGEDAGARVAA